MTAPHSTGSYHFDYTLFILWACAAVVLIAAICLIELFMSVKEKEESRMRPRISYFRDPATFEPILSTYMLPFAVGKETWYAVGMSLCTSTDRPNKAWGRTVAQGRAEKAAQETVADVLSTPVTWAGKGYRIFTSKDPMVTFFKTLRAAQWNASRHAARQRYREAFFGWTVADTVEAVPAEQWRGFKKELEAALAESATKAPYAELPEGLKYQESESTPVTVETADSTKA